MCTRMHQNSRLIFKRRDSSPSFAISVLKGNSVRIAVVVPMNRSPSEAHADMHGGLAESCASILSFVSCVDLFGAPFSHRPYHSCASMKSLSLRSSRAPMTLLLSDGASVTFSSQSSV